uniref:WASH complex subunit FAM21 n=1 Tax=Heterorhabditis bacteriophora TaxID=37862 RepID=A0A1I7WLH5_HETBA
MEENIIKLQGNIARWTLADDSELCTLLEQVTNNIVTRCGDLESKLSELARNTGILDASIQNMNCSIMLLANTKFIEQKVQEDCHVSLSNSVEQSSECDVNSQAKTIDVIQNAIQKGIELFSQFPVTSFGDHIHTNGSMSDNSPSRSDPLVSFVNNYFIHRNENIPPTIFANEIKKAAERIQNKKSAENVTEKTDIGSARGILDDKPRLQLEPQIDRSTHNECYTSKGISKSVFDSESDDEDNLFKSQDKFSPIPISIDRISGNKSGVVKQPLWQPVPEIKTSPSSSKYKSLFDSDSDAEDLFRSVQDTPINHRSPTIQIAKEPIESPVPATNRAESPDIFVSKTSIVKSDESEENMPGKLSNSAFANILNNKLSIGPPSLMVSIYLYFDQDNSESPKFAKTELLESVNKSRPKGPSRRPPRKKLENVTSIDSFESIQKHVDVEVEPSEISPSPAKTFFCNLNDEAKADKDDKERNGSMPSSMPWKTSAKSSVQKSLFESDSEDDELFKNIKAIGSNATQRKRENITSNLNII